MRLLREASVQCAVPGINSGELAFALEKAVMEAFGAGQPRYFEFISRVASQLKVGNDVFDSFDLLYLTRYQPIANYFHRTTPI